MNIIFFARFMLRLLSSLAQKHKQILATTLQPRTPITGTTFIRRHASMEKATTTSPKAEPFIVAFYGSGARDDEGRDLEEILSFSDHALERYHDYIQVIFPVSHPVCGEDLARDLQSSNTPSS